MADPARLEGPHARGGKGPIVDGDTQLFKRRLAADTKDWEIVEGGLWVRILGVDTPATNRLETRASGLHFTAFAEDWLTRRAGLWPLTMDAVVRDSFGRWLAAIADAQTGKSLSDALIAEGDRIGVDVRYPGGASVQIAEVREAE